MQKTPTLQFGPTLTCGIKTAPFTTSVFMPITAELCISGGNLALGKVDLYSLLIRSQTALSPMAIAKLSVLCSLIHC